MNELHLIGGGVTSILTFFIVRLISQLDKVSKEIAIHQSKILVLENRVSSDIDNLKEFLIRELQHINTTIVELKATVVHAENTMKTNSQGFQIIYEELKKSNSRF